MLSYKKSTKLSEVIKDYPGIARYLADKNPKLKLLKNTIVVQIMAPKVTLNKIAKKHSMTFEELLEMIEDGVKSGEIGNGEEYKKSVKTVNELKAQLKTLMKKLFEEGKDIESVKKEFKNIVSKANPILIAVTESELTKEGYSIQDLMKACDVHLELFKDQLMNSRRKIPKEHPLRRFIKDHDAMMLWFEQGLQISRKMKERSGYDDARDLIKELEITMKNLKSSENHDVRQENTLFPVLEKYGIEEPPAIMWDEHTKMKEKRNKIEKMLSEIPSKPYEEFVDYLQGTFTYLVETFMKHTQKEQEILYNVALDMLSEKDWQDIQRESDRLGYFELPKEVLENE